MFTPPEYYKCYGPGCENETLWGVLCRECIDKLSEEKSREVARAIFRASSFYLRGPALWGGGDWADLVMFPRRIWLMPKWDTKWTTKYRDIDVYPELEDPAALVRNMRVNNPRAKAILDEFKKAATEWLRKEGKHEIWNGEIHCYIAEPKHYYRILEAKEPVAIVSPPWGNGKGAIHLGGAEIHGVPWFCPDIQNTEDMYPEIERRMLRLVNK